MRAPSILEALVTSSLIVQAVAQAPEYSDSNNIPAQSSADGSPGGDGSYSSDSAANSPSCIREGTTTVFVTVVPAVPSDGLSSGDDSSGGSGSGNGDESDSGSGETVYVTLGPTTTVFFSDGTSGVSTDGPILSDGASQQTLVTDGSPAASEVSANSPATATDVNPFTTVTIDIWGTGTSSSENNSPTATTSNTGSESSSGSGSDAADAPQYTSPGQSSADSSPGESPSGSPSEDSSHGNSDGSEEPSADVKSSNDNSQASITITFGGPSGFTYHPSEQNTDAGPTAYGSLDSSGLVPGNDAPSTTVNAGQSPEGGSPWYTVVTDVDVNWITGSNGPSQVTAFSIHTLTFSGSPTESPGVSVSDVDNSSRYTIVGPDGKTTVLVGSEGGLGNGSPVETSAALPNNGGQTLPPFLSSSQNIPPSLPTDLPGSWPSAVSQGDNTNQVVQTTATSYTLIGQDGQPTVMQYTWTLPQGGPLTTDTAILPGSAPTDSLLTDFPRITLPGPAPTDGAGSDASSTTCFTFTFTGTDGLPTVVDSTVVLGPTDSPVQPGGEFSMPREGTISPHTTFTIIGPDGLPTIVESPLPSSTFGLSTGLPSDIGSAGGSPTNNGAGVTTCTSFTILGADGLPTIVESTYIATPTGPVGLPNLTNGIPGPVITGGSITAFPTDVSGALPATWPAASGLPSGNSDGAGITTCTTFTLLGSDGLPTIVETSWTLSDHTSTEIGFPGGPQGSSSALPPGFPWPLTPPLVVPTDSPGTDGSIHTGPVTTRTTFTVLGTDGVPTVIDSTWVVPGPQETQAGVPIPGASNVAPSDIAGQLTNLPGLPTPQVPGGLDASTTCTSFTILGQDGLPTVVETTWAVGPQSASSVAFPTMVPQQSISGLPQGIPPVSGAITTSFTAISIGANGLPTPVVQTVVIAPDTQATALPAITSGVPYLPSFSPVITTVGAQLSDIQGVPPLSEYGPIDSNFTPVLSSGALPISGVLPPFVTGTTTGTTTATLTMTTNSDGSASGNSGAPSYDDSLGDVANPGFPSELTLWPFSATYGTPAEGDAQGVSMLQTSTWTNLIAEQTTTYTMNYPLTTMAAVTPLPVVAGGKRMVRRQEGSFDSSLWSNSSLPAIPPVGTPAMTPTPITPSSSAATMCSAGGKIGNVTVDFDDVSPGPLYNPTNDFWFSGGFSIIPPSGQSFSYLPSSGGQLMEFVPSSLTTSSEGSGDTAEIGVGPNFASPHFRFNFYGANLGCAAESAEQWCEFEVSAYAFDEASGGVQSIAWSETKRIPACVGYPAGSCYLTPVDFEGYNNISSVLVTLHVGLDLRAWWADDLRVGWTDNSCEASQSRSEATAYLAKQEGRASRLRRHLWNTFRLV